MTSIAEWDHLLGVLRGIFNESCNLKSWIFLCQTTGLGENALLNQLDINYPKI